MINDYGVPVLPVPPFISKGLVILEFIQRLKKILKDMEDGSKKA